LNRLRGTAWLLRFQSIGKALSRSV